MSRSTRGGGASQVAFSEELERRYSEAFHEADDPLIEGVSLEPIGTDDFGAISFKGHERPVEAAGDADGGKIERILKGRGEQQAVVVAVVPGFDFCGDAPSICRVNLDR